MADKKEEIKEVEQTFEIKVESKLNIYEKLIRIQCELKAPKNQFNKFGNYRYRNCEDILESVKPIMDKYKTTLVITDSIETVANRIYIKATATLYSTDSNESISTTAFAREEEEKKGMDASQVTGASSSYARKYCLNGLFSIDDTKDSDTTNTQKPPMEKVKNVTVPETKEEEKPTKINGIIDRAQAIAEAKLLKYDNVSVPYLEEAQELKINIDNLRAFFGVKFLNDDLMQIAIKMKRGK